MNPPFYFCHEISVNGKMDLNLQNKYIPLYYGILLAAPATPNLHTFLSDFSSTGPESVTIVTSWEALPEIQRKRLTMFLSF